MTDDEDLEYHGRDWSTTRSSVAEALCALDYLHDLSLSQGWLDEKDPDDDDTRPLNDPLMDGVEQLGALLSFALADLVPPTGASAFRQRWIAFEATQKMGEIQALTREMTKDYAAILSGLVRLTSALKLLVKKLDT